jgi:hypothetical protein
MAMERGDYFLIERRPPENLAAAVFADPGQFPKKSAAKALGRGLDHENSENDKTQGIQHVAARIRKPAHGKRTPIQNSFLLSGTYAGLD